VRQANREISPEQIALIYDALQEVTALAVLYERRLVFKDRYREKAVLAATKVGGAKAILRILPRVKDSE
jgi:hypothetical protein